MLSAGASVLGAAAVAGKRLQTTAAFTLLVSAVFLTLGLHVPG